MPFLATLHGLVSPRQPSLLNSLASVQLSNLRHCWRCTHTRGPARYWSIKLQLAVGSKRLPDHLVHVIITIGGEAPDEDRKSTRLNSSPNAQLVCRLLLGKKKI